MPPVDHICKCTADLLQGDLFKGQGILALFSRHVNSLNTVRKKLFARHTALKSSNVFLSANKGIQKMIVNNKLRIPATKKMLSLSKHQN